MDENQALFEDWKAKHEAVGALVTKHWDYAWKGYGQEWPREPSPAALRDPKAAIRELEEAKDAEAVAWQALVDCIKRGI